METARLYLVRKYCLSHDRYCKITGVSLTVMTNPYHKMHDYEVNKTAVIAP